MRGCGAGESPAVEAAAENELQATRYALITVSNCEVAVHPREHGGTSCPYLVYCM